MDAPGRRHRADIDGQVGTLGVDLALLCCPSCRGELVVTPVTEAEVAGRLGEGAVSGLLCAEEGWVYPIVDTVPYLIREAAFLRSGKQR